MLEHLIPKPQTPESLAADARGQVAFDAALRVFGDERVGWIYRPTTEFGRWATPHVIARDSEEGFSQVMARLEELAKTTVPVWNPRPKGGRKRTFKPRR